MQDDVDLFAVFGFIFADVVPLREDREDRFVLFALDVLGNDGLRRAVNDGQEERHARADPGEDRRRAHEKSLRALVDRFLFTRRTGCGFPGQAFRGESCEESLLFFHRALFGGLVFRFFRFFGLFGGFGQRFGSRFRLRGGAALGCVRRRLRLFGLRRREGREKLVDGDRGGRFFRRLRRFLGLRRLRHGSFRLRSLRRLHRFDRDVLRDIEGEDVVRYGLGGLFLRRSLGGGRFIELQIDAPRAVRLYGPFVLIVQICHSFYLQSGGAWSLYRCTTQAGS